MKYPIIFLFASIVLPVLVFVILAGMVLTELGILLEKKKDSGC